METIKFIAFLFYKYYSTGPTSRIPYFSTLCALVLMLYMHVVQILLIFNITDIVPTDGSQMKAMNFVKMALFMIPFFVITGMLVKKSDLNSKTYSPQKIKTGYIYLIVYIILSFILIIVLALYKKGKI